MKLPCIGIVPNNAYCWRYYRGMRHGTLNGYNYHKCRCELCCEANAEYKRKWYEKNREVYLDKCQTYKKANIEARRAYNRNYGREHRDEMREYQRRHRDSNRTYYIQKWLKRRALKRNQTVVAFTAEQLSQRWAYYGDKCWICRGPATETDHVKPLAKGGAHMLCNMRPACRGCNASKNAEWAGVSRQLTLF